LAGRRLCSYYGDGLDGKILCRRRANSYGDSYGNSNRYRHADSNTHADFDTNGHTFTNCNSIGISSNTYGNGYCNGNGHGHSDRHSYNHSHSHAHADGNINPVHREVYTDPKASANSGAAAITGSEE
jgi:hypothetical protein